MKTIKTVRIVSGAGAVVSLVLAGVIYLINTGPPYNDHERTWCVFGFVLLEYVAWQYLWICVTGCPGVGKEGHKDCVDRCFLRFLIIQLVSIILLLFCLLVSGPNW